MPTNSRDFLSSDLIVLLESLKTCKLEEIIDNLIKEEIYTKESLYEFTDKQLKEKFGFTWGSIQKINERKQKEKQETKNNRKKKHEEDSDKENSPKRKKRRSSNHKFEITNIRDSAIQFFGKNFDMFEMDDFRDKQTGNITLACVEKALTQPPSTPFPVWTWDLILKGRQNYEEKIIFKCLQPSSFIDADEYHTDLRQLIEQQICKRISKDSFTTESDCIVISYALIKDPIEIYSSWAGEAKLDLRCKGNGARETKTADSTHVNSQASTFATSAFLLHCHNILKKNDSLLLMFGEQKVNNGKKSQCHSKLRNNFGLFETKYYGRIPFVLCFEQIGEEIEFYIYFRKNECVNNVQKKSQRIANNVSTITQVPMKPAWHRIGPTFDITKPTDRLAIIFFSLNIARAFHCFVHNKLFNKEVSLRYKLGLEEYRDDDYNITILIDYNDKKCGLFFRKMIIDVERHKAAKSCDLQKLYELIKKHEIRNTYDWFEFFTKKENGINSLGFYTCVYDEAYVGINSQRSLIKAFEDIAKALTSLHQKNFVHRDLRWSNILYISNPTNESEEDVEMQSNRLYGKFILIDFEHSGPIGKKPVIILDNYPEELEKPTVVYLAKHDWYLYGKLMLNAQSEFSYDITDNLVEIAVSLIEMNEVSDNLIKQNAQELLNVLKAEREKLEINENNAMA